MHSVSSSNGNRRGVVVWFVIVSGLCCWIGQKSGAGVDRRPRGAAPVRNVDIAGTAGDVCGEELAKNVRIAGGGSGGAFVLHRRTSSRG